MPIINNNTIFSDCENTDTREINSIVKQDTITLSTCPIKVGQKPMGFLHHNNNNNNTADPAQGCHGNKERNSML